MSEQLLEQQSAQREHSQMATWEKMRNKKRATKKFTAKLDPDGESMGFEFRALNREEFNAVAAMHPATEQQKQASPGADVNDETFPPALLAAVCQDPKLSYEQWREIYTSDDWSTGELLTLFYEARNLCQRPLEISPFV